VTAVAAERRRVKAWKQKAWYEVMAPAMFGGAKVGEVPASDPAYLIGRVFETTLGDLIDDFSKSHVKLYFQIKHVDGSRALTEYAGHEIVRDYIRSQVRRRSKKAEDVVTVATKDGYTLRITSMTITFGRAQSSKVKAIRGAMRRVIEEKALERNLDQFVQEMVLGKLASDIYKEAKRFHPIRRVEVYKSKVLGKTE
jgi:small subunit ribosomal protein S3Ae